jgi:ABC-type transport system substrate-binding protein
VRVVPATGGRYAQAAHEMSYSIAVPSDLDFDGDRAFQEIAADWARIGVRVHEYAAGDTSQAYSYFQGPSGTYRNYDIGLWYYAGYIDPNYILSILTRGEWGNWNDTGFNDATYNRLYTQQLNTVDQSRRAAIVKRMEAIVNADKPYVFLVNERWVAASGTGWKGFDPNLYAEAKTFYTDVRS